MKHTLLLFIILNSSFIISFSQAPLEKEWDYRFGGTNHEYFSAFRQTNDGGYILAGQAKSGIGGNKTQANRDPSNSTWDYWVVKIDSMGIKQWDKSFGGDMDDELLDVQITNDGGYILGGQSRSGINGDKTQAIWGLNTYDYWVVKIDSAGNKQWDKDFGGTGNEQFGTLEQTGDGGYILGGWSTSGISGDKTQSLRGVSDYWIVKIDGQGNYQWDKGFGGPSANRLSCVKKALDGGYIMGGYSYSGVGGDKTEPNRSPSTFTWDYWVIKVDSAGTKQWDKDFGGKQDDIFTVVLPTRDKGYILGGYSFSQADGDKSEVNKGTSGTDNWIVKIDSAGAKQWDKDLGGNMSEELADIYETSDSGYFISGASYSRATGDKSENNLGEEQTWILKLDSQGNKIWDKTIFTKGHDEASRGLICRDGGILVGSYGQADSGGYKTQNNWNGGSYDYWVAKFKYGMPPCNLASPNISAEKNVLCGLDSSRLCAPTGFAAYLWNTSGSTGDCMIAKQAGDYFVTVTDANSCTAVSNHVSINVPPLPLVHLGEDTSICEGQSLLLDAGNANAIYKWQNDSTGKTIVVNQGGNYWVGVTKNGCSSYDTILVVLNLKPSVNIATGEDILCAGDSTRICAPLGFASYQWNVSGVNSNCTSINQAGSYYLTVTDNNGCTAESNHLTIFVYPVPSVSITVQGDTLSSFNSVSYQWYLNDTLIPGETSPVYIAKITGNYAVEITDTNGCKAISSKTYVLVTGIEELGADAIKVYPDPFSSFIYINVKSINMNLESADIYDVMGKLSFSKKFNKGSIPLHQLEVSALPAGVYYIRVKAEKGEVVQKMIKL